MCCVFGFFWKPLVSSEKHGWKACGWCEEGIEGGWFRFYNSRNIDSSIFLGRLILVFLRRVGMHTVILMKRSIYWSIFLRMQDVLHVLLFWKSLAFCEKLGGDRRAEWWEEELQDNNFFLCYWRYFPVVLFFSTKILFLYFVLVYRDMYLYFLLCMMCRVFFFKAASFS